MIFEPDIIGLDHEKQKPLQIKIVCGGFFGIIEFGCQKTNKKTELAIGIIGAFYIQTVQKGVYYRKKYRNEKNNQ